jgi:hypothetical protein
MNLCVPSICGNGCAIRKVYEAMEIDVADQWDKTMAAFTMDSMTNPAGSKSDQALPLGSDFSIPWATTFHEQAAALEKVLFIMQPEVREVLDIWQKFDGTRLCDIAAMNAAVDNEPFELERFVHLLVDRSEEVDDSMHTHWFSAVVKVFQLAASGAGAGLSSTAVGEEEEDNEAVEAEAAAMHASVSALLQLQLQSVLDRSVQALADAFASEIPGVRPLFNVKLVLNEDTCQMHCSPSLPEIQAELRGCFDKIVSRLQTFTKVDDWLAGRMSRLEVNPDVRVLSALLPCF